MNEQQQRQLDERITDDEQWVEKMRKAATYDALMARAEAARLKEAGRMVQEEVAAWRDSYETLNEQRLALAARVAELESQQAAQGWRPVTEKPEPDQKVEIIIEATFDGYGRKGWTTGGFYFNADFPTGWRPLPPTPQETE